MSISELFRSLPYQSKKHSSYFAIYEHLFEPFRGKAITFVEIGVLNGGSLFMWRSYFGNEARIIGVDLNPEAKKWEADGFEIHIGNQANPQFWAELFPKIGKVDVLLDDGGHTFEQQIVTTEAALPWIKDGGLLVVEDTHTSYMSSFGGPSSRSFVSYVKNLVDGVHYRSGMLDTQQFDRSVFSIAFFESIVALHVNKELAGMKSEPVVNGGESSDAVDYRHSDSPLGWIIESATRRFIRLREISYLGPLMATTWTVVRGGALAALSRSRARKLGRHFKY